MNRAEKRRKRKLANKETKIAKPLSADHEQTLTIQQAIDRAVQYHQAGDFFKARGIYQQILQANPNQPIALHLLGVIAHQAGESDITIDLISKALAIKPDYAEAHTNLGIAFQETGKLDEAADSYIKAITIKPDYIEAHNNLGNTLQTLWKLDEAVASYGKALAIKPDFGEAHNNLGNALKGLGKLDEAVVSYNKAIAVKPDYAEAHSNLGNSLQALGKLDEAVESYHKAITIKPDYAEAHSNLGNAFKALERYDQAVASYGKALAIQPDYAEAQYNLGNSLQALGKLDEAVVSYKKAIAIKPDFSDALSNLGTVFQALGRLDKAVESYKKSFELRHGGPWLNAENYLDVGKSDDWSVPEVKLTSTFKLRETIDQFDYLIANSRIDPSFQRIVAGYRAVLSEIQLKEGGEGEIELTHEQLNHIGSSYNRAIYCPEAQRIKAGAINTSLDFEQIEDHYLASSVSVTTLDNFLKPEALGGLRKFCLESTIFFDYSSNNFVGSMISRGFNCDLLSQIAKEIKQCFPKILRDHDLTNIWVYRYNNQSKGVAAHTDEGAVTFNLWITPDKANLYPDSGGLIVFTKDQPYEWDWRFYNQMKNTTIVEKEIATFLADADSVTIPHRENRATLFHSNLFHKSDQIYFKEGYKNRRMNITFLFGTREGK